MRLTSFLNTTEQKVLSKEHNIWLGISLGNKYFNRENIENYIKSSLELTKKKLLIIIADEPQAINYGVFEEMKEETALAKAQRNGQKIFETISTIINTLPEEQKKKTEVIRWESISTTPRYLERLKILTSEFESNIAFKNKLIDIVKLNMGKRLGNLSNEKVITLAKYVLQELPIFLGAIDYKEVTYDLHLYPGLSLMDDFVLALQAKQEFPKLMNQIEISENLAIAEAYAK